MDKDGFGDFAVGAPYEDNGKGVVVLYFGTKDIFNMNRKPSNVLRATSGNMGFGASFSKKIMDIDENQLSDLAVGSFMSGDVVIFRRLASVWSEIVITPSVTSIDIDNRKREYNLSNTCTKGFFLIE